MREQFSVHSNPKNSNNQKGRLLEEVVAMLYENEGYEIRRNASLPSVSANRLRKPREIDVLLTTYILGEPNHTVIQCKNEKCKIGIERIDEFTGFLQEEHVTDPQSGHFNRF